MTYLRGEEKSRGDWCSTHLGRHPTASKATCWKRSWNWCPLRHPLRATNNAQGWRGNPSKNALEPSLLFDLKTLPLTAASAKPTHQKCCVQTQCTPCAGCLHPPLSSSLTHHWPNHIYVSFNFRIGARLLHLHKRCNRGGSSVATTYISSRTEESHPWQHLKDGRAQPGCQGSDVRRKSS